MKKPQGRLVAPHLLALSGPPTPTRHPWNCPLLQSPAHDMSPGISLQSKEEYGPHRGTTCLHCQGPHVTLGLLRRALRPACVQHRILLCHGCWGHEVFPHHMKTQPWDMLQGWGQTSG